MRGTSFLSLVVSLAHLWVVAAYECAPGGILNLDSFELQLPTGKGGDIDIVRKDLLAGCNGYSDENFFTSRSSGCTRGAGMPYITMKVAGSPESCGCTTTPNSKHCRTELREVAPERSWDPRAAKNRLRATVRVMEVDDGDRGTIIGQIHISTDDAKVPAATLYYSQAGHLMLDVKTAVHDGDDEYTDLEVIPVGQMFTYELRYEDNELSVSINDGKFTKVSTHNLHAPPCNFKVGAPPPPAKTAFVRCEAHAHVSTGRELQPGTPAVGGAHLRHRHPALVFVDDVGVVPGRPARCCAKPDSSPTGERTRRGVGAWQAGAILRKAGLSADWREDAELWSRV